MECGYANSANIITAYFLDRKFDHQNNTKAPRICVKFTEIIPKRINGVSSQKSALSNQPDQRAFACLMV